MKHVFATYHPAVGMLYITAALVLGMLTLHPVYLALSLAAGSCYAVYLHGARRFCASLKFILPMFLLVALANPLFNHRGATLLFYLFGNPVTQEAVLYGVCAGAMLAGVLIWCSCLEALITHEKFLYLFGGAAPTLALMLSMILKLIPTARYRARSIVQAQDALLGQAQRPSIRSAARNASVLVGWSMEDSIETADSMRARGYGAGRGRTTFSLFRFRRVDALALGALVCLLAASVWGMALCLRGFAFYPVLAWPALSPLWYAPYALLLFFPLLVQCREVF